MKKLTIVALIMALALSCVFATDDFSKEDEEMTVTIGVPEKQPLFELRGSFENIGWDKMTTGTISESKVELAKDDATLTAYFAVKQTEVARYAKTNIKLVASISELAGEELKVSTTGKKVYVINGETETEKESPSVVVTYKGTGYKEAQEVLRFKVVWNGRANLPVDNYKATITIKYSNE